MVLIILQTNGEVYPTLRHIAIDYLACQASSVPCECLLSSGGEVATKRRAQLGNERFEQLVMMKSAWMKDIGNLAAWNLAEVEEVDEENEMIEYEDMLTADRDHEERDKMGDKTGTDELIVN